jgi:hypothetical protein
MNQSSRRIQQIAHTEQNQSHRVVVGFQQGNIKKSKSKVTRILEYHDITLKVCLVHSKSLLFVVVGTVVLQSAILKFNELV